MSTSALRCQSSNYALLWPVGRPNEPIFYFPTKTVRWTHEAVEIVLLPEDTREITFLHNLKPGTGNIVIAYGVRVALATIVDVHELIEGDSESFRLTMRPDQTDFSINIDAGLGDLNADQLATMRAKRLLLNDYPILSSSNINEVTRDLFIGGQGTLVRISESVFPPLYRYFGKEPIAFLNIAWIAAVSQLMLSNCVVEIDKLVLELIPEGLRVSFHGRRGKRYVNQPPYEIVVEGLCKLRHADERQQSFVNIDQLGPKLNGLSAKISFVRATPEVAERAAELVAELEALLAALPPR